MAETPQTYREAGVDIDEAQRALRAVAPAIRDTYTEGVIGGIGGFGGLFRASFPDAVDPILVSSIDGVGTKTKVAQMVGDGTGLGHDIVNHCANDILCQGARPLFFLDYYGCSRLSSGSFEAVVSGMAAACRNIGCALIGGETAEMPGVYESEEFDVVGCIVGCVDMAHKLPRSKPQPGDAVIGIASDGLHTNGYSLARRVLFEVNNLSVRDTLPGLERSIGEELLRPHRCYVNSVLPLVTDPGLYAVAHITGGGLYDNVPRVLPSNLRVMIEKGSWTPPPIFRLIQELGNVPEVDMYRTFNMGIGMVLLADRVAAPSLVKSLVEAGESAAVIGEIQAGAQDVQII
jgi:phosphoribosylformylglycinamidine cyclo-ligase